MLQEIFIIDNDIESMYMLKELFKKEKEFVFRSVKTEQIDIALKSIPSLIIINEDSVECDVIELCKQIRANEDNSITPIIVVSNSKNKEHQLEILKNSVEYYIIKPVDEEYLYYTIKNIIRLMYTNRRVSPLTGLPGNVQIQAELKKRLLRKEAFEVLYFDLDNFKSYNDKYGFLSGDEIIKFTAQTIIQNITCQCPEDCFIGHIGGDDFVAIISNENYEEICQSIVANFDEGVKKYFSDDDIERGYVEVANRKGIIEQFPLTAISIAVVEADKGRFHNTLEIGEIGAQVKHIAKTTMGSSYAINRRKNK